MARSPSSPARVGQGEARRAFSLRFIGEATAELRRVTWPTRQETMRLTLMVISIALAVGLFLGLIDLLFTRLFDVLLTAG